MEYNNGLNRSVNSAKKFPSFLQSWILDMAIGRTVKFVGTSGIHFEKMTCNEVVVSLKNRSKVQNHIHQVHAAATTLLAETATGMAVGMNIPDDKIPLMKNLSVKFIKRSRGAQTAVASLTNEQIKNIRTKEKGDVSVAIKVTDETGEEVILAEMNWAWIPKNK